MSDSIGTPHTPGPPLEVQPNPFAITPEMLAERDKPVAAPGAAPADLSPILDMLGLIIDDLGKIKKRFAIG